MNTVDAVLVQGAVILLVATVYWGCGELRRAGVRANYTRKVVHFVTFLVPVLVDQILLPQEFKVGALGVSALTVVLVVGFWAPIRTRAPFFDTMFASIDRPEDRPHTLVWLATQLVAGFLILVAFGAYFERIGRPELILLPVIVNGLGDGLAEPVGIRWGRHTYRVWSWSGRRYTRSLEGSAAVLVVAILTVLAFRQALPETLLWPTLLLFPALMTLTEAVAPHTWDSPFLFLVGGATLAIVLGL